MILHDLECDYCGLQRFDEPIEPGEIIRMFCIRCGKITTHSILFVKLNSPLRGIDLINRLRNNPRDVAKRITTEKPEAHDCDGNPLVDKQGNVLHDKLSDDKFNERKEKRLYTRERKLGLRPIYNT